MIDIFFISVLDGAVWPGPELEQETSEIIVSIIGYQIRKTAKE